ncbi:MAG TPA: MFS transporter [Anaerolineae bacterium]|nr:MFS transporter [Anaerolineae bacterium]
MTAKRTAWVVTLVAFLAGVAATVNQFKVPPALPTLLPALGLDMASGGWLMSVFSVAAIFLSIPAALVLHRVGLKRAGIAALGCVAAGSALGAVAGNATTLLVSRLIEGVGMSVIAVASPALISLWFEPGERGLPMGIWAAWVPAGSVLMFNAAPTLEAAFGWRGIWWAGTLFALLVLALFALLARLPGQGRQDAALAPPPAMPLSLAHGLSNPASWLLAITFGVFAFGQLGYSTWAPSFLSSTLPVDAATASFYTSLLFLSGIIANLSAGWAINRIPHRPALLVGAMVVNGVLLWWGFRLGVVGLVVPYMLALGLVSNAVPPAVFTLAPETVKRPEAIGLAVAAINVVSNLAVLLGPPIVGAVVAGGRWAEGSTLLALFTGLGVLSSLLAWRAMRTVRAG